MPSVDTPPRSALQAGRLVAGEAGGVGQPPAEVEIHKLGAVLTHYHFPSFQVLGIGQMIATVIILNIGRALGIINFPELSTDTFRKIWPLPLMYLGNMVFGLGGTQNLSLPMMTVLRRFSILMTMIGKTANRKA